MPSAIPRATYRLQLSADFGFDEAARRVPYLKALGISHLYASPFLKARPGSTHGYDITDHNKLNPEFGGEAAFARLSEALAEADIGLILDFVPNHMGVGYADNAWWLDVLEWGPKSAYAAMFDIDWDTLPYRRNGGVLLPILGKPYGEVLEGGEIDLRFDPQEGSFSFWYFDHRLPVRPDRYSEIVRTAVSFDGGEKEQAGLDLIDLANRYGALRAPSSAQAPEFKRSLSAAVAGHSVIQRGLAAYAADESNPNRTATLHRLLERQHYRLAHWRVAISEINYRRFFDINDLAGLRIEDPKTFQMIHRKVAELIGAGQLHGLRLDHIDGLYDPAQYCLRLRRLIEKSRGAAPTPFYVVAEKILAPDEAMPALPGVAGTTGYDVLNLISRVLTDDSGLPALEAAWQTAAAPSRNFAQMVVDAKTRVIETTLASEFTVLVRLLSRIAAGHWPSRDYTSDRLRTALELFILNFPVYRTYIAGTSVSERDRATIETAVAAAREQWYGSDIEILDFLRNVLTLDVIAPGGTGYSATRVKRFAAKVQQFTGPVTAKAVEDTAFYRYHRLLALNEVGNDPSLPALSVANFHKAMETRVRNAPHAMTATATHDTKRGEDARMRLIALSELAEEWGAAVQGWRELNKGLIVQAKGRAPSRAHEYMLYQALLGAWAGPDFDRTFIDRISAYAVKAAREGKLETSWTNTNAEYEAGLTTFIARLLDPTESQAFLSEFDAFARRIAMLGVLNGLSQLVLKCLIPGVPDFYQGTEFWDLSLVDPDNRRPVDFGAREGLLAEADRRNVSPGPDNIGKSKLALIRNLLDLRAARPEIFCDGRYEPVEVRGRDEDHVIAFARVLGNEAVIAVVTRHYAPFTDGGRFWPKKDACEATLSLERFAVDHDVLNRRPVAPDERLALTTIGAMPAAVLLARRR